MTGTTYTSASVVIMQDSIHNLQSVRDNLALLIPMDWMEREMLDRVHTQVNDLIMTVAGLQTHREKGDKAQ